ncbi:MAG: hypothetical protein ABS49_10290 [Erythrobacter sp. SCN 62-14]|nr:MAG: hypothetical protein ABS49_10290 [Erythrobacter sp. SCN 62-14]
MVCDTSQCGKVHIERVSSLICTAKRSIFIRLSAYPGKCPNNRHFERFHIGWGKGHKSQKAEVSMHRLIGT